MASSFSDAVKRLLVGRPFRSDHFRREALGKRVAMPVFASDMLSSVAYAPDEILLALSIAGITALHVSPWVGLAVGVIILIIVACYKLNVTAYPSGGGDYVIASRNLGRGAGLAVAAALMVDYMLTLAVSLTVFSSYIAAAFPELKPFKVIIAVAGIMLVTLAGLRGAGATRRLLAVPTYLFLAAVITTIVVGAIRVFSGDVPVAETSDYFVVPTAAIDNGLLGIASVFLVLRAFSSGSVALAGVQTVATAVPSFRKPRARNAGNTLLLTGALSAFMLVGITWLAAVVNIKYVSQPHLHLVKNGGNPIRAEYEQDPVLGQLAHAVFSDLPIMFYVVVLVAALVLLVAANTAVEGFPGLASRLAVDSFLPRQLATRGDRMTFSNGILLLAAAAVVLVVAFGASAPALIQLYLVGVFVSFVLGQFGMIRHWTTRLRKITDPRTRNRLQLNRVVSTVGFVITAGVLLVVLITKFFAGAWLAVAAMIILYLVMGLIHRHYSRVRAELTPAPDDDSARTLPSNTHALVIVTEINKPTLRALAYARAARATSIEALTVAVDEEAAEKLARRWDQMRLPVELTVLDSPYREIVRPVMNHVQAIRRRSPRDLIIVYIPQYIVGRWWEHLLHNQTALRLKSRLLFVPNVMVASVPWRLDSFKRAHQHYITQSTKDHSEASYRDYLGPL